MMYIEFFKLQAKNLFKDYNTQLPFYDSILDNTMYEYSPKYFDISDIITCYDVGEEQFRLMKAQHIIALMSGFKRWQDLLRANESELELAQMLLINRDIINIEHWQMYIAHVESETKTTWEAESKIELLKHVFLNRQTSKL